MSLSFSLAASLAWALSFAIWAVSLSTWWMASLYLTMQKRAAAPEFGEYEDLIRIEREVIMWG